MIACPECHETIVCSLHRESLSVQGLTFTEHSRVLWVDNAGRHVLATPMRENSPTFEDPLVLSCPGGMRD